MPRSRSLASWIDFFNDIQQETDRYSQNFTRLLGTRSGAHLQLRDDVGEYGLELRFDGSGEGMDPCRHEYTLIVSKLDNKTRVEDVVHVADPWCSTEFALRMYYGTLNRLIREKR